MKLYESSEEAQFVEKDVNFEENIHGEMTMIKMYSKIGYQKMIGFGGAFTEAAASVWSQMGKENQEKLVDLYFGKNGSGYNFCRTHIQSCDFALGNYAYVEDSSDKELKTFSIERDKKYIIPLIKAAQKRKSDISFLASPWSPPAFMKTNADMNHGGKLKPEFRKMWADMMARYVAEFKKEGIPVERVTVQNEPQAVQTWDSCIWTGKEEGEFAKDFLRPSLDAAGAKNVKINVWDHNKEIILERAEESLCKEFADSVDGVAFHWYSGDHFESLAEVCRRFPEKDIFFSEGCVEYSRFASDNQTAHAEMYAHDMIGNFNAGAKSFIDWNLFLNKEGGPNHVGNFCDAPVMCDTENDTFKINLSYYYIAHFSRFIQKDAVRVLTSRYTDKIETCGFVNPDGSHVLVLLNRTESKLPCTVNADGKTLDVEMKPHSIISLVW